MSRHNNRSWKKRRPEQAISLCHPAQGHEIWDLPEGSIFDNFTRMTTVLSKMNAHSFSKNVSKYRSTL
jgi:hypothetical protein